MKQKIIEYKNNWRDVLVVATAVLVLASLVLVGFGINQNNKLAAQNKQLASEAKQHLDCIIKLSETPLGVNDRAKFIDNLNNTCQIKFTQ